MSFEPKAKADFFDTQKYGGLLKKAGEPIQEVEKDAGNLFYVDGSDALANDGLTIDFEHVPSGTKVYFKAFISAFNETYSSDWSEEAVFGRADPIRMFKQTTRSITLAFLVPAATLSEGYENLTRVQKLVQFLYPNYRDVDNALSISQSPLIRLKLMNMITDNKSEMNGDFNNLTSGWSSEGTKGLLGAITNVSINQNLDNPDYGVFHTYHGTIVPKMIEVALDFKVIHENHLGWTQDSEGNVAFSHVKFPYNAAAENGIGAPRTKVQLLAAQNQEAVAYTQGIREQRQADADFRSMQAAQDIARAELLKADGTLNAKGRRLERRLDETTRDPGQRRWYVRGISNPEKAGYYAAALTANEGYSGADVRQAGIDAAVGAQNLKEERWSWIK